MNERLLTYIGSSFLSPLLEDKDITDITYNGKNIYYQHNKHGRLLSSIILDKEDASNFLRQIANYSEQQFSYASPIIDVKVGQYRINGVHSSLARVSEEKTVTFSIRISRDIDYVSYNEEFLESRARKILKAIVQSNQSIVIAGIVGVGKTELQKYLLAQISDNSRVIVIDNIQELDLSNKDTTIDLTNWKVNDYIASASIQSLVRNALRSNPDWLIVAESRGSEMGEILNAAMSGHPIITTIHAKSITTMLSRIVRMIMMSDKSSSYEEIASDVKEHFPYYVYLKKKVKHDGTIVRYVDQIAHHNILENTLEILYSKKEEEEN